MSKKGARKSGGGTAAKRDGNKRMAARMRNVVRTTGRCPICHKIVANAVVPFGHVCG